MGISLREVFQRIDHIAKTPSTNEKVDLLKKYLQSKLFKRVIWCTYTQTLKYNVKAFPKFNPTGFADRGFEFVLPILKQLSNQNGADSSIKNKLFQAASIDKETYRVVEMICDGDLQCGIGARLINKAVPNTVKILSYQRCQTSKFIDSIVFEPYAIAQCKADGAFANLIIDENLQIKFLTRNGKEIFQLEHLKKKIKSQNPLLKFGHRRGIDHSFLGDFSSKVFFGELRVFNPDGSIMNRKAGNGVISQCLQKLCPPDLIKRIFYTTWGCTDLECFWNGEDAVTYGNRFYETCNFINVVADPYVKLIQFENVKSLEEAYSFFRKMRSLGEEGEILKNISGIWEDDQSGSKDCIKIKHSFECDLRVVGWNYGTKGKKYGETVGSIDLESECGKLKVNVSGLLDSEREWDWDMMIGTIVTVEAESVITSKTKEKASLYTPSFIEPREDKDVADTLEEIIVIAEESKKTRRRKA